MSVQSIVFEVIKKARKLSEEQGLSDLIAVVERAETVVMIEMWDADLNLETQITDTVLASLLAEANPTLH